MLGKQTNIAQPVSTEDDEMCRTFAVVVPGPDMFLDVIACFTPAH